MFTYFFSLGLYHDVWLVEGNLVSLLPLSWISFFTKNNKKNFEFNNFLSPEMAHVHCAHMITNIITRDCCHIYNGALFITFNFFDKAFDVGRAPETHLVSPQWTLLWRGALSTQVCQQREFNCAPQLQQISLTIMSKPESILIRQD